MRNWSLDLRLGEVTTHAVANTEMLADRKKRLLFQLVSPVEAGKHPTTTFTFEGPDDRPLKPIGICPDLPDAVLFKSQPVLRPFGEAARLRVHFLLDFKRPWFVTVLGRFIQATLSTLVKGITLGQVTLDQLLGEELGFKLGDKTYSQKLGYFELDLATPTTEEQPARQMLSLKAPAEVSHCVMPHPGGRPGPVQVVLANKGDETARVSVEYYFRPVS